MEISFETKAIRMICEKEEEALSIFETDIVQKLKARLSDLVAAKNVNDLFVGNPSEIIFQNEVGYKIDLDDDYQIIFFSNHTKSPTLATGKTDWSQVNRIKIMQIIKNHEEL